MRINPKNDACQVLADNKISHSGHLFCKLIATVKENLSALIQRRIKENGVNMSEEIKKAMQDEAKAREAVRKATSGAYGEDNDKELIETVKKILTPEEIELPKKRKIGFTG